MNTKIMLSPEVYNDRIIIDINDLNIDQINDVINGYNELKDLEKFHNVLTTYCYNLFESLCNLQEQNQAIDPEIAGRYYELTEMAKQCEARISDFYY